QAWATALGGAQDDELATARVSGLVRSVSHAPDDALDVLGQGLQRPRAPCETSLDDYRARLLDAWPFWEGAPTLSGLTSIPAPYMALGDTFAVHNDADGFFWGGGAWFSRVAGVVVGGHRFAPDGSWGVALTNTWGDGGLWGLAFEPTDPSFGFGVA